MKTYLNKLPRESQDLIYLASNIASRNNMSCYLVGGFVRDLLLGMKNLDLDIVVEGDGIKFARKLGKKLKAEVIWHGRFKTATVSLKYNQKIDIATARRESYPEPASLPVVTSGVLKDDLCRRDFTINAMAIGITGKDFGQLIDLFNGKDDLFNKKIRVLHDLSFIDDPTRMLRAVRFEKRYNFKIEPNTLSLMKEAVRLKMLEKVSPERLREELILILKEEHPVKQIRRIQELLGFDFISSSLSLSKKTYKLLQSIENQIKWFMKICPQKRKLDTWLIYFMGLIDSLNINDIKLICRKLAFRKGEEKRITGYKRFKSKFIIELNQTKIKPSRIFGLLEPLSYEVILLIKAKFKNNNIKKHIEDFFQIYNGIRLCISGDDLYRMGIPPGPYYQKIFSKVLKAKLDGRIKTKEEELALIKRLVRT